MENKVKMVGDLTFKNLETNGNDILADCSNQLLAIMQQINKAKFSSVFVPVSWFSSLHSGLTKTTALMNWKSLNCTMMMITS